MSLKVFLYILGVLLIVGVVYVSYVVSMNFYYTQQVLEIWSNNVGYTEQDGEQGFITHYLSFSRTNGEFFNHVHFVSVCFPSMQPCYVLKKNGKHSELYYVDVSMPPELLVNEMKIRYYAF